MHYSRIPLSGRWSVNKPSSTMYPGSSLLGRWGASMAARRQAVEEEGEAEERRLDEYIANMTDTIHIAYTDASW